MAKKTTAPKPGTRPHKSTVAPPVARIDIDAYIAMSGTAGSWLKARCARSTRKSLQEWRIWHKAQLNRVVEE